MLRRNKVMLQANAFVISRTAWCWAGKIAVMIRLKGDLVTLKPWVALTVRWRHRVGYSLRPRPPQHLSPLAHGGKPSCGSVARDRLVALAGVEALVALTSTS
jgi:hypothetical protein